MPVSNYYYRILEADEMSRLTFADQGLVTWWNTDDIQSRVTDAVVLPRMEVSASWSVPLHELRSRSSGPNALVDDAFRALVDPMADMYIDIETAITDQWTGDGNVTIVFHQLHQVLPSDDPASLTIGMTSYSVLSVCMSEHPPIGGWLMDGAPFRMSTPLPSIREGSDVSWSSMQVRGDAGRLIARGIDRAAMGRFSGPTSYVGITHGLEVDVSDTVLTEAEHVKVWKFSNNVKGKKYAEFLKDLPKEKLLYYIDTGRVWQDRLDMLFGTN